jgi:hypothetical protein
MLGAFLGCSAPIVPKGRLPDEPSRNDVVEDDRYVPPYRKAELGKALIAERGAEATGERVVAELAAKLERDPSAAAVEDQLRVATADLDVRRQFIASLEACESRGAWCPPRLDDPPWKYEVDPPGNPPLDAQLRFDLESWRRLAAELHGRACACRTLACVDGVGVAIDTLETRPMADVQGDEVASQSITRARECLFRLRGKQVRARAPRLE